MIKIRTLEYSFVLAFLIILLPACGPSISQTTVSNSIPYEAQQRINTSEEFDANYIFEGSPDGDRIVVDYPVGTAKSSYSVNSPLKGKLGRLMSLKFGDVTSESSNVVKVSVEDISTTTERVSGSAFTGDQVFEHTLEVTVGVEINRNGTVETRNISRSTTIQPEIQESRYSHRRVIPEEDIEEFLMQFVVGVDSFIDSNFGIEG